MDASPFALSRWDRPEQHERRILMRPSEAIRPHLQQAVDDIDYFLTVLEEQEIDKRVWSKLYELLEAGWTPPKVKERLTKTQYMAQVHGTKLRRRKRPDEPLDERRGKPLTDEEREAILADLEPGEPISDAGREALQFALRGGWRESSRRVAAWLRNAGETVAADGIDVALSQLPDEPRDATELSGYLEAMRTAAEYVKTILVHYPIQRQPSESMTVPPAVENGDSEPPAELLQELSTRLASILRFLWKNPKTTIDEIARVVYDKDFVENASIVTAVGRLQVAMHNAKYGHFLVTEKKGIVIFKR
jgi:hypothetical protein